MFCLTLNSFNRTFSVCLHSCVAATHLHVVCLETQFIYMHISECQIKSAVIYMFILTMDQITMCNVKDVAHSDEPADNYCQLIVPLSNMELISIFQLLVLVLWRATVRFTVTALKRLLFSHKKLPQHHASN